MKIFTHSALLMLLLGSALWALPSCTRHENQPNQTHFEALKYLALGDSYTIGTSINYDKNWPSQLTDSLKSHNFSVDTTVIIAQNGWTTTDLKTGIAETEPKQDFNLVSLLIGVNNQYQGMDISVYKTDFRELLEQAITFAGGDTSRVFVVSIPNYGVTPFASSKNPAKIRAELSAYNQIAQKISAEYTIPFINITPISELATDNPNTLLAADKLHPSAEMYSKWIEKIQPTIVNIMEP